jgi:hypothetical protein
VTERGGFVKDNGLVLTRRHWIPVVAYVGAVVVSIVQVSRLPAMWPANLVLMIALLVGAIAAFTRWPRKRRGKLVADVEGLRLNGKLLLKRDQVARIYGRQDADGTIFVRIVPRTWTWRVITLDVAVAHEAGAQALLRAMRLDGAHAVVRFQAGDGSSARVGLRILGLLACLFILMWSLVHFADSFAAALLAEVIWGLLVFRFVLLISLGADAMRIKRSIGGSRLVPYSQIATVEADGTNVHFKLRDSSRFTVSFGANMPIRVHRAFGSAIRDNAEAFVERVRERIESHRAADVSHVTASLTQGGRTIAEWHRAVTSATDGAASFRVPAVPPDALLSVALGETASADARLGAIMALRYAGLDDITRDRVRVAAEACADPKLRSALQRTVDAPDDDALESAVEAFVATKSE